MSAAAPESPVWLEINGRRRVAWTATASHLDELVLGRLLSDGYIRAAGDVTRMEPCAEPDGCHGMRVSVPEENVARVARERRHVRELGCGLLHFVTCEPEIARRPRLLQVPSAETLRDAFRALFAQTDAAFPEGGMHAAALLTAEGIQPACFDVGRHNAADRALGRGLAQGLDLARAGLLISARVSGAIALQAARAGVAFVASRSIPTTLAEQIAAAAALPVVARAGQRTERGSG